MSTILDALRKLQREHAATAAADRDLRDSVTSEIPGAVRTARRSTAVLIGTGALLLIAGGASWLLLGGGPSAEPAQQGASPLARATPTPVRSERPRVERVALPPAPGMREPARPPTAERTPPTVRRSNPSPACSSRTPTSRLSVS